MAKWLIPIELPGDPSVPLGAATKQYVDNGLALKAPLASPALTGVPTAPLATADTATSQLATTLYVTNQASAVVALMDGVAAVGTSLRYARADHVHPSDTSRLAVSAYTAADVLSKLITVDGATSGLDADLLDGQQGTYYSDLANATGNLAAARLPAFSGDISTPAGSTVTTIGTNKVTLAMMAQITTASFLGRVSASTGNVEVLSVSQVKTALSLQNVENTALSTWTGSANLTTVGTIGTGVWNATIIADAKIAAALTGKTYNGLTLTALTVGFSLAGGTTSKTLTVSDNATVSGTNTGDQTISLTGDVVGSGTSSFAATIQANAVTLAKFQQIATASFLGRSTAGTGNVEVLTVAQTKTLLALVKADVGLSNVDNTSDVNKPVSTAQQTALDLKADLASPTLTGVPLAPTAAPGTNTTQIATTAFVGAAITAAASGSGMSVVSITNADVSPLVTNTIYMVSAGGVQRDMTLPASVPQGFKVSVNVDGGTARIVSNGNVIDGIGSGNNVLLEDGNTISLVARATGQLEILYGAIPGPEGTPGTGGGNFGTAEIDFGVYPGGNEAQVVITGQTTIPADANIIVSMRAVATTDHTAGDHAYAAMLIGLAAGAANAGVGFTIYARSQESLVGKFNINWTWG